MRYNPNKPTITYDSRVHGSNIYFLLGQLQEIMRNQKRYTDFNNLRDRVLECIIYEDAISIISEEANLVDTAKGYYFESEEIAENHSIDDASIESAVPVRQRLEQAAEECTELAQALLKLCRTLPDSKNPTVISQQEAISKVKEECADVYLCVKFVSDILEMSENELKSRMDVKKERWLKRLKENNI